MTTKIQDTCFGSALGHPEIWPLAQIHALLKPIDLPGVKNAPKNFRQNSTSLDSPPSAPKFPCHIPQYEKINFAVQG